MKQREKESILLLAKEVAILLRCPIKTVYNLTSKNIIPSIKIKGIGRRYRFSEIENWIYEGGAPDDSC